MKNWRTTTVGLLGGITLIIKNVIAVLDADTATNFSYEEITVALGLLGIGWFAKDAGVSGTAK
jgi:hypothetical protein